MPSSVTDKAPPSFLDAKTNEVVCVDQVSDYLKLSHQTVRNMARNGTLRATNVSGSQRESWRFVKWWVEHFLHGLDQYDPEAT